MPQPRVLDLSPLPAQETALDRTLNHAYNRYRQNSESDALANIYKEYQSGGKDIMKAIAATKSNYNIGPKAKTETIRELLQVEKINQQGQKKSLADIRKDEKAIKDQEDAVEVGAIENLRGAEPGSLKGLKPARALAATKPQSEPKVPISEKAIDPDQLSKIQAVRRQPGYAEASPSKKYEMMTDGLVSRANARAESETDLKNRELIEQQSKNEEDRAYKYHKDSAKYEEDVRKDSKGAKTQLDSIKGLRDSIEKTGPSSFSNVLRFFGEPGKRLSDAFLSKDEIRIQASIPVFLEGKKEMFGVRLSDADLRLLSDKLPDISKTKEANRELLDMAEKYAKLAILKEQIASDIKKETKGMRLIDFSSRVEDRLDELKKPVKIIRPDNKKVIEIPLFELQDAIKAGASLYNE